MVLIGAIILRSPGSKSSTLAAKPTTTENNPFEKMYAPGWIEQSPGRIEGNGPQPVEEGRSEVQK